MGEQQALTDLERGRLQGDAFADVGYVLAPSMLSATSLVRR